MDDLWDKVREAAESLNPKRMISLLYESGYLDGLENKMRKKWPNIPPEAIDNFVIGAAVDALYGKISKRELVSNPGGYIYKVVHYKAAAYKEEQKKLNNTLYKEIKVTEPFIDPFDDSPQEMNREYCLNRALDEARKLLPRLGQENVQKVMGYVFDCIDAQKYDVKPVEIAEVLCLSSGTVRISLKRGFDRLKRIAIEDDLANQILEEAEQIADFNNEEEVI